MSNHENIGIGIGGDGIEQILKELQIKPDRQEVLNEFFNETMAAAELRTISGTIEIMHRFIAYSTKANELAFLIFMLGISTGTLAMLEMTKDAMPTLLHEAAEAGAQMAQKGEFPTMVNENGTAPGLVTAKTKTGNPEDRMYG